MQHFHKFITWRLCVVNMFRSLPCPSSEAYNCISSLWFYRWSVVVATLLVVDWQVWQTTTNNAATTTLPTVQPEAANAVVSSWWWARKRPKRAEPQVNVR
jgi:hypothetical protein